jgi:cytidylate kinase
MIVTLDGPAGTGKSSVAQQVAGRLSFDFLDTGAMYRAIAYEALRRGANLADARELAFVARHCRLAFNWSTSPPTLLLNGEPLTHALRSGQTTQAASAIAVVPAIRELLVAQQQAIGRQRPNLVSEGRDQGTVVFPDAALKFYLDATPQERARRRVAQLRARGEIVNPEEILAEILVRDQRDSTRAVGPLRPAADAVTIDTTSLTQAQVVDQIVRRVQTASPIP